MTELDFAPSHSVRCLLVQPMFSQSNYWNFVESAQAIGAKATAPPLGLLTVAAILPQHWTFRIVDLNVASISEEDWLWADLVCTGGMLPQQAGILEIIARAKCDDKYVVVGGPDPTSQPELYVNADAIVLGEGEASIPVWLDSWEKGKPFGTFASTDSVDLSTTPIPRFDLISFDDYLYVGLQTSRGCPYNCEFCDVIELFGRKPRVKSPGQFVSELQRLHQLGYRGWIDIADDNFIGNRLKTKPLLAEVLRWQKKESYPFIFSTEASVNLADDDELLELMRDTQFRYVFLGIETPDSRVLSQTQKKINTTRPLIDRVRRIYDYGMSITAGFILGFDSEPDDCDRALTDFIQESGIMLAMVGLLTALPNTQLTRRLAKERRLISSDHKWINEPIQNYRLISETSQDQTVGGLNFVTVRDRVEIYRQLREVANKIYSPKEFMDRVLDTTRRLKLKTKHTPNLWELKRMLRGWISLSFQHLRNPKTRWYFLRNMWKTFWMGPSKFVFANQLMGSYLHFLKHTDHMNSELTFSMDYARNKATYPRSVSEMHQRMPSTIQLPTFAASVAEVG